MRRRPCISIRSLVLKLGIQSFYTSHPYRHQVVIVRIFYCVV